MTTDFALIIIVLLSVLFVIIFAYAFLKFQSMIVTNFNYIQDEIIMLRQNVRSSALIFLNHKKEGSRPKSELDQFIDHRYKFNENLISVMRNYLYHKFNMTKSDSVTIYGVDLRKEIGIFREDKYNDFYIKLLEVIAKKNGFETSIYCDSITVKQ